MTRSVPEWVGRTPDSAIPPRVKLRVFERHEGRCYLTGRKIRPGEAWEIEHIIALCNGGEHRESNLAPALNLAHKLKTTQDVAAKARTARIRKRHVGIKKPSRFACSKNSPWRKKIDGSVVPR